MNITKSSEYNISISEFLGEASSYYIAPILLHLIPFNDVNHSICFQKLFDI